MRREHELKSGIEEEFSSDVQRSPMQELDLREDKHTRNRMKKARCVRNPDTTEENFGEAKTMMCSKRKLNDEDMEKWKYQTPPSEKKGKYLYLCGNKKVKHCKEGMLNANQDEYTSPPPPPRKEEYNLDLTSFKFCHLPIITPFVDFATASSQVQIRKKKKIGEEGKNHELEKSKAAKLFTLKPGEEEVLLPTKTFTHSKLNSARYFDKLTEKEISGEGELPSHKNSLLEIRLNSFQSEKHSVFGSAKASCFS